METRSPQFREQVIRRGEPGKLYTAGRFLISLIFVASGFSKLLNFDASLQYMASVGMPPNEVLLGIATAIELLGGFALLTGFGAKFAAWMIAAYLVPVTLIFHTNFGDQQQVIQLLKNLAIIGGLLQVAEVGRVVQVLSRLPIASSPVSSDGSTAPASREAGRRESA